MVGVAVSMKYLFDIVFNAFFMKCADFSINI